MKLFLVVVAVCAAYAEDVEPVNGGFTKWTEFGECSASCGGGLQVRVRSCTNPKPAHGGKDCDGPVEESKECGSEPCPVDGGFTKWTHYGPCSASCGGGVQVKIRTCTNPAPAHGGKDCVGPHEQSQECGTDPCPVDGGFTPWSKYGPCSKSCGGGSQIRERFCTNPAPAHGGKDCVGPHEESQKCGTDPCPVDGGWTPWYKFGSCSRSCGGGVQELHRTCTNPAPAHGGKDCVGPREAGISCATDPCPVDGGLTPWGNYGPCSKSCGGGTQVRDRSCTNPAPAHGGKDCVGPREQSQKCGTAPCPVDGGFTPWGKYGPCSKSCGGGTQVRERSCTNPPPSHGGKDCVGPREQTQKCGTKPCPIDGKLGPWTEFSACSKTCGPGTQVRTRVCTPPKYGGKPCDGPLKESKACKVRECPIDGKLGPWTEFSACSKTCGPGTQVRTRVCTPPKYGGKPCDGPLKDSRACKDKECPIDGNWGGWGAYGECSKKCGGGLQIKTRACDNPKPQFGGKPCPGESSASKTCNAFKCVTEDELTGYLKGLITKYYKLSHEKLSVLIQNDISKRYTGHYFSTNVYNPIYGFQNHAIIGNNYAHIFKFKKHNVVVAWVTKAGRMDQSTAPAALAAVTDSGDCNALNQAKAAWKLAENYSAMVMIVREGYGLKLTHDRGTLYFNYRCKRTKNWLGRWKDHKSSMVIVYGSN